MSKWPYNTSLWLRMRAERLRIEPVCRYCRQIGLVTPADTVDHIRPHRGDINLAFDADNLQSCCAPCHDRHAQAKDRGEAVAGCDASGYPLDPTHVWGS